MREALSYVITTILPSPPRSRYSWPLCTSLSTLGCRLEDVGAHSRIAGVDVLRGKKLGSGVFAHTVYAVVLNLEDVGCIFQKSFLLLALILISYLPACHCGGIWYPKGTQITADKRYSDFSQLLRNICEEVSPRYARLLPELPEKRSIGKPGRM